LWLTGHWLETTGFLIQPHARGVGPCADAGHAFFPTSGAWIVRVEGEAIGPQLHALGFPHTNVDVGVLVDGVSATTGTVGANLIVLGGATQRLAWTVLDHLAVGTSCVLEVSASTLVVLKAFTFRTLGAAADKLAIATAGGDVENLLMRVRRSGDARLTADEEDGCASRKHSETKTWS
jgi:hypothetical protein